MRKDFNKVVQQTQRQDNIEEITKSLFSAETINKVDGNNNTTADIQKKKRKYTKLNNTENKEEMIHVRLSKKDLEKYKANAIKHGCRSFSEYVNKCLEKGL